MTATLLEHTPNLIPWLSVEEKLGSIVLLDLEADLIVPICVPKPFGRLRTGVVKAGTVSSHTDSLRFVC